MYPLKLDKLIDGLKASNRKTYVIEKDSFGRSVVSLNIGLDGGKVEVHAYAEDLIYVISGSGTLESNGLLKDITFRSIGEFRGMKLSNSVKKQLKPGFVYKVGANVPHRIVPQNDGELVYLVYKNYLSDYLDSEKIDPILLSKLRGIKALILDVDGTMTDGKVLINSDGEEFASFSRIDSWGLKQLQERGIKIAMISYEKVSIAQARGKKLKIPVFNDIKDKVRQSERIIHEWGVSFDEVCFVGDDVNDLPLLKIVGVSTCPSDAQPEVRSIVNFILPRKRGENAVRFLTDLLIATQGEK